MCIHSSLHVHVCISSQYIVATISQLVLSVCAQTRELVPNSVVLVWLHMIKFSCSEKASEGENLVLVLVSQLKRKKGYYM